MTQPSKDKASSFRTKPAKMATRSLGICFFFFLCAVLNSAVSAQVRPKILGIGRVSLQGTDAGGENPFRFYAKLQLGELGGFQSGAVALTTFALNDHQEITITVAPRPEQKPQDPPGNNLAEVLFETSDVRTLHDYLKSKGLSVDDFAVDGARTLDADGSEITGNPSIFRMQDPDGHRIGFIQLGMPLRPHFQETSTSTHLLHAGFVVRTRTAMEHFYKDILGFRPYWHGGMKDDQTDWISLQVPDGTDWVEFMVNVPENADRRLRGIMNHIALGVPDIQAAREQLVKNGVHLTEEPKLGRDGKWQLNVYDPDQTRIEFMEFTPKEKPCCSEFTGSHPKP